MAVAPDRVPVVLDQMCAKGFISEGVLLSTCNRTELYTVLYNGNAERLARLLTETASWTEAWPTRSTPSEMRRRCVTFFVSLAVSTRWLSVSRRLSDSSRAPSDWRSRGIPRGP